jgi:hypothetical protein
MDLLTIMLMSGLHGPERNEFLNQVLPTMLRLPVVQRQTLTALMAERQVRLQSRVDEQLVREAVKAANFSTPDQLASFPTLQQKYNSLSDAAKERIIFLPVPGANTAGSRKS